MVCEPPEDRRMAEPFRVGLTHDFLAPDGRLAYRDIGLDLLDAAGIEHRVMDEHPMLMRPEDLRDYDAVISLAPRYEAQSLHGVNRLVAILRFGVGYDMVDVAACTERDVLLCITKGAVDHSMAEAIVTWMLALSHRVLDKDRLLRQGRWPERGAYMGRELRDRKLGVIGLGGIGRKVVAMCRAWGMTQALAHDPLLEAEQVAAHGVALVPLERVLGEADFVVICCPLNDQTRNLIGPRELSLMRDDAYLINAARGGIVNEAALIESLRQRRIAGAAIDVFEHEPAGADHPLAALDNVVLAPHCIGWTDELFRDIGRAACGAAVQLSRGQAPCGVVNSQVRYRPGFERKLCRFSPQSLGT
jgi:phosphoglycerate dehydrogenase-like enzyme